MATALYSLVTNQTIKQNLAMTGELDLVGKVMPIGGLKEKVLAARRNRITTVLIPRYNKRDLDELEAEITEGITFHLMGTFDDVLVQVFESDTHPKRNDLKPLPPVAPAPAVQSQG